jgi:uncharacterized protein DUF11
VGLAASAQTLPTVGAELDVTVTVSTKNAGGSSDAQLDVDLPAGFSLARTYTDRGSCSGGGSHVTCDVAWINTTTSTHVTLFGTVAQAAPLSFTAVVASKVESELDPSNNSATVTVQPAPVPVDEPVGGTGRPAALRAIKRPQIVGRAAAGRTLYARAGSWSRVPRRVSYRWQICGRASCRTASGVSLRLRRADVGRTVRILAVAADGGRTVIASSARVVVRSR